MGKPGIRLQPNGNAQELTTARAKQASVLRNFPAIFPALRESNFPAISLFSGKTETFGGIGHMAVEEFKPGGYRFRPELHLSI